MITHLITDVAWGATVTSVADLTLVDWTDISDWVEEVASPVSLTRGSADELPDGQAGTLSLTLDNSDGRFTPHLTTGPYFPNVVKDVPIRQRRAVLASPVTRPPYPLDQFADAFTDNVRDPVLWVNSYGTVTETGGRARVSCIAGVYSGYKSNTVWTLQDSSFTAQMPTVPAASTATSCHAQVMVLSATAGTRAGFQYSPLGGGTLQMRSDVGYVDATAPSIAYNATNHKWLRVRESGGTLYWDTSPDGMAWTLQRTADTPGWVDTDWVQVDLQSYRDAGATDYAEYDSAGGVNQPPRQPLTRMSDDFDDDVIDPVLWSSSYGTRTEAGGQARVSAVAGVHSGYRTARTWTLLEAQVTAELVTTPDPSTSTTCTCNLMIEGATAGTRVGWELDVVTGILKARRDTVYVDAGSVSLTYDPAVHRWLKVRHTMGNVFWETSADGVFWTFRRVETAPAWIATDAVAVEMHAYRDTGATSYAAWDLVGATMHSRALMLVNQWPTTFEGLHSRTPVTCTDLFAWLQGSGALQPMLVQEVLADRPAAYYPLSEDSGSTSAGNATGWADPGVLAVVQKGVGGSLEFGSGTGPATGLGVPLFDPAGPADGLYLTGDLGEDFEVLSGAGDIFIEAWFASSDLTGGTILTLANSSRSLALHVALAPTTGQLTVTKLDYGIATVVFGAVGPNLADGAAHHVVVDTGGQGVYVDGVLIGTNVLLAGVVARRYLYVGAYIGGTYQWTGSLSHVAVYDYLASAAQLTDHYIAGTTGYSGETALNRVERLLGYVGLVSDTTTAVDTVGPQLQLGSSALDHLREVELAEGGKLFASRRIPGITLTTRLRQYNVAPSFTLRYVDAEPGLTLSYDDQRMVNTVIASRPGGATQRIVDQNSVLDHGPKEQPLELIKVTDGEVATAASYLLARHSSPLQELRSATFVVSTLSPALYRRLLDADIGSVFAVTEMPAQAPNTTEIATIAGYAETTSAGGVNTLTFHCYAADTYQYWELDDPVLSVLDSTTRLAY